MPNMKALSLRVKKLFTMLKFADGQIDIQTDGQTDRQTDGLTDYYRLVGGALKNCGKMT